MSIGENIRYLRKTLNLTQSEFAQILNTTQQNISYYEKGDRVPSLEDLRYLAKHFNIPFATLITEEETSYTICTEFVDLYKYYTSLSKTDKHLIQSLVLRLCDK